MEVRQRARALGPSLSALAGLLFLAPAGLSGPNTVMGSNQLGAVRILIRSDQDTLQVLSLKQVPAERAPETSPRPSLTTSNWTSFAVGSEELLLAFLAEDGSILEVHGWPGKPAVYLDVPDRSDPGRLRPLLARPRFDDRRVFARVSPKAKYMTFVRTLVHRGGPGQGPENFDHTIRGASPTNEPIFLGARILRIFGLPESPTKEAPRDPPPRMVLPFDDSSSLTGRFADLRPHSYIRIPWPNEYTEAPYKPAEGILEVQTLPGGCDGEDCYNVVVVGDGFADTAGTVAYQEWVQILFNGLFTVEPFSQLQNRIKIFSVVTESAESGISYCSQTGPVDTYYQVEGKWPTGASMESPEGYLGSRNPQAIYHAADGTIPDIKVHLFLVIANCEVYGGCAYPMMDMAFLTLGKTNEEFVQLAAHESAHVIADLCEEYIGCLEWDGSTEHPNMQYIDDDGDIAQGMQNCWWQQLSENPGTWLQRDAAGNFANLHGCIEVSLEDCEAGCVGDHNLGASSASPLGLYWGCQYLEPDGDGDQYNNCDWCQNPADGQWKVCWDTQNDCRSRNFYRAMPTCKMRRLDSAFCPACQAALTTRVQTPWPLP